MNLVKAQDLVKDLPIPELQKYANGLNPQMIPPWLATGEIQAKMDRQKKMQMMQGASQEEQPSIKEQIEQKAGLMAAQSMQQQQMQQQQAQQMSQRPGPAPANVPQPEAQPQPQMPPGMPPAMMARGGLARIPVNFNFQHGGIVAFSGEKGSQVNGKPRVIKLPPDTVQWEVDLIQRENPDAIVITTDDAIPKPLVRDRLREMHRQRYPERFPDSAPAAPPALQAPETPDPQAFDQSRFPMPQGKPAPTGGGLADAAKAQAPAAPRPQAAAPAAPAPQANPYMDQLAQALKANQTPQPTTADAIRQSNELAPRALQEAAVQQRYQDQRARADQERSTYAANKPSGLDNAIRFFGQSALSKGMSGMGPAYTAMKQQERSEEQKMQERLNELYNTADANVAKDSTPLFNSRTQGYSDLQKAYVDSKKFNLEGLAQMAQVTQKQMEGVLDRLSAEKIAALRSIDSNTSPAERVTDRVIALMAQGKNAEAEQLVQQYGKITNKGEAKEGSLRSNLNKSLAKAIEENIPLGEGKGGTKDAAIAALRAEIAKLSDESGGKFAVQVGDKKWEFPTQQAADAFKAKAGVK